MPYTFPSDHFQCRYVIFPYVCLLINELCRSNNLEKLSIEIFTICLYVLYFIKLFTIKRLFDYNIFTCAATTSISPRTSSGIPSNICSCSPPSPVVSDFYIILYYYCTDLCDQCLYVYMKIFDENTVVT